MTLGFPPERIGQCPLAKLQPCARNVWLHGADQVLKITASMAEFGWTVPCLVADDGELIAGHGRVLAATRLRLRVGAAAQVMAGSNRIDREPRRLNAGL
jgi:ParB-like chromosome segregation protein Spo0J